MATKARSGIGTLLQIGDGATPTETFTTIPECYDITGPEISTATEDATSHDSPNRFEEFIPTVKSGGSITFQMTYIDANVTQQVLRDAQDNLLVKNFRLIPPSATKRFEFAAIVEKVGHAYPVKGKMVCDCSLKVSGKPTLVANS